MTETNISQCAMNDGGFIENDELDPRIQTELEILNSSTDEINKLENEYDEGRTKFRQTSAIYTQRLNLLAKKLGRCIRKARPYYEAVETSKTAQVEAQRAARKYQQAQEIHRMSREAIQLAEERLMSEPNRCMDTAWQEMLNHSTMKVLNAERERTASEREHRITSTRFTEADAKVQQLSKKLTRNIAKAKPYFEWRAEYTLRLEQQKQNVVDLQKAVTDAKQQYADALRRLESISDEIHDNRKLMKTPPAGTRGVGVGAESDEDSSLDINFEISSMAASRNASFATLDDDVSSCSSLEVFSDDSMDMLTSGIGDFYFHDDNDDDDENPLRVKKRASLLKRHVSGRSESDLQFSEHHYRTEKTKTEADDKMMLSPEGACFSETKPFDIPSTGRQKVKLSAAGLSITPDMERSMYLQ
ncbi:SH3 domain-binding protein 5-like [Saccoglossus kowalevskii]|uniref:SH3 domain-binding protein 5-like n=1 Tax=Saccoglossus kowalevskii TaxID=10224 RepID=A0ABM0GP47_SACKO|nr:PREDICTED: SH3 domain-binding protein 5-like [Saccoglossus kowalevskii]